MTYVESYLNQISNEEIKKSVLQTIKDVVPEHIENFSFREHVTGLLLGNVQSGKTGQMFGLISAAADVGFKLFVLLTTDNVYLQNQTFKRAIRDLIDFEVCDENDETRFFETKLRKPTLIVLKKNTQILKTWKNNIASSKYCDGAPLFIIDDEGDASSMNTKVNKNQQSTIYRHLVGMKKLAASSIYLQVTGTPQPIILQTQKYSELKPSFAYYFKPGNGYMGGDFFFSDPESYVIRLTKENEVEDVKNEEEYISEGLQQAIFCFLVAGAHIMLTGGNVCNFLVHPSIKIKAHNAVRQKIAEFLNTLIQSDEEDLINEQIKTAWLDMHSSKPDIKSYEEIKDYIHCELLNETISSENDDCKIKLITMNSKSSQDISYDKGLNIIIGGNSLGRGVTFEGLQIVYYSRTAKVPQMDTYWQHCRMFGYNRDKGLLRIFISPLLWKLFRDLNISNQALIDQIANNNIDDINLLVPKGTRATRKCVVRSDALIDIVGGANYFPNYPQNDKTTELDSMLKDFDDKTQAYEVKIEFFIDLLKNLESEQISEWDNNNIISCLQALNGTRYKKGALIVRRERDIRKGTGTLLSPNDRDLGKRIIDKPVLTLYRIKGQKEKGWNDQPLWIPNIKFPDGIAFCKTIN